jgi:hypothetical protein
MEHVIEFGGSPQDVTITTSGIATVEAIKSLLDDLLADPRYHAGMAILIDHSGLDMTSLTTADVKAIARFVVDLGDRLGNPLIAHVTPTPGAFGVMRMGRSYAARASGRSGVFYTLENALAWLVEESGGSPDASVE